MSEIDPWSHTMAVTTQARNIRQILSRCPPVLVPELQHILWSHLKTSCLTVEEGAQESQAALALVENLAPATLGGIISAMQRTKDGAVLGKEVRAYCIEKGETAYLNFCNLIPNAFVVKEACSPSFLNWLGVVIKDPGIRNLLEDLSYLLL